MLQSPLDLGQLRSFYALGQAGSFVGAAERLGRTPSAVNHAIRKLEQSAGVRLVERRGRGVRLTEDGQRLFAACETVYATVEGVSETLGRGGAAARGRLRLGAPPEFGCSVLMRHIGAFVRQNPEIHLDFTLSDDLLTPLRRGEIDVAIDCVEHFQPDLQKVPLFRESYMVVCAPSFRRARRLRRPADLSGVPLLSLDEAGAWWHRLLRAVPETARPELRHVIAVNHIRAMITAAVEGIGVALVPSYSVIPELEGKRLVQLFPHIELPEDRFRIYQKKTRAALEKHRKLVAYLQSINPAEFGSEVDRVRAARRNPGRRLADKAR
jgi:LysR family transcriptional regulator, glycine cleavage system transcriptional activator